MYYIVILCISISYFIASTIVIVPNFIEIIVRASLIVSLENHWQEGHRACFCPSAFLPAKEQNITHIASFSFSTLRHKFLTIHIALLAENGAISIPPRRDMRRNGGSDSFLQYQTDITSVQISDDGNQAFRRYDAASHR